MREGLHRSQMALDDSLRLNHALFQLAARHDHNQTPKGSPRATAAFMVLSSFSSIEP